jgi:hypothetical protein
VADEIESLKLVTKLLPTFLRLGGPASSLIAAGVEIFFSVSLFSVPLQKNEFHKILIKLWKNKFFGFNIY